MLKKTGLSGWLVAIAALVILGVGAIGVALLETLTQPRRSVGVVNMDTNDETLTEVLFYAPPTETPEGRMVFPLGVEQNYRSTSSPKSTSGNTLNYLVVNRDDTTRWVFEGNGQLVLRTRKILRPLAAGNDRTVAAVLLEIIRADTNEDGRLSRSDSPALLILTPEYASPVELLTGYDRMSDPVDVDADRVRFLVTAGDVQTHYELSLSARSFVRSLVLPTP